ncbi:MAG: hypothetical protein JO257_12870 [Deltaproteobacteria bacterium]|nr:hypothetical protein [Deltaproteobacteria bacterium]
MHTVTELGSLAAIFAVMIGGALSIRARMKSETGGAVLVVVCAALALIIGWVVLERLHRERDHQRLDAAITSALGDECKKPAPAAPDLAAMHELMCAADTRNAELRVGNDIDVGVVAHGELVGTALPRIVPGKTYVVALVDASGAVVVSYPIDPKTMFSYLRDTHVPGAKAARLYVDDKAVADAPLK